MKKDFYDKFKYFADEIERKRGGEGTFSIVNRGKNRENLLYILAGYKPELWNNVFGRILKENLDDFDVCILSSGLYSSELNNIAEQNGWSYLYAKENRISNIQNKVISCFPKAKTIWKLDEDMFLCRDYF